MTPQQLIFIRHGESLANAGGNTILPNAEIPLTEQAHQEAQQLADRWEITPSAVYTSDFLRTQQTTRPFCEKYQLPATPLTMLNECDTLGFDYLMTIPAEEKLPLIKRYWQESNPHERIGEMGETYHEFCNRVAAFKTELSTLSDQSLIIGHGMWFAQFLWQALNLGDHAPTSDNIRQFGNFFLHLPVTNLAQFNIVNIAHNIAISKR